MKKACLLAAGAVMALSAGSAQADHWVDDISVSTTWAYESKYIFRGVQFAEDSFQPDVQFTYKDFYIGAWASLPVGDDEVAFGDEIDLYAGYNLTLSELVSATVGVTYYMFPDVASGFFDTLDEEDGTGANTVEPFVSFSFDTVLSPALSVYYDFMFETVTIEGGLSHSFPIMEKVALSIGGTVGYVADDDDGADYAYGSVTADLGYTFTDNVSASLGVRYGVSSERTFFDDVVAGTFDKSGFWGGVSVSAGF